MQSNYCYANGLYYLVLKREKENNEIYFDIIIVVDEERQFKCMRTNNRENYLQDTVNEYSNFMQASTIIEL